MPRRYNFDHQSDARRRQPSRHGDGSRTAGGTPVHAQRPPRAVVERAPLEPLLPPPAWYPLVGPAPPGFPPPEWRRPATAPATPVAMMAPRASDSRRAQCLPPEPPAPVAQSPAAPVPVWPQAAAAGRDMETAGGSWGGDWARRPTDRDTEMEPDDDGAASMVSHAEERGNWPHDFRRGSRPSSRAADGDGGSWHGSQADAGDDAGIDWSSDHIKTLFNEVGSVIDKAAMLQLTLLYNFNNSGRQSALRIMWGPKFHVALSSRSLSLSICLLQTLSLVAANAASVSAVEGHGCSQG